MARFLVPKDTSHLELLFYALLRVHLLDDGVQELPQAGLGLLGVALLSGPQVVGCDVP